MVTSDFFNSTTTPTPILNPDNQFFVIEVMSLQPTDISLWRLCFLIAAVQRPKSCAADGWWPSCYQTDNRMFVFYCLFLVTNKKSQQNIKRLHAKVVCRNYLLKHPLLSVGCVQGAGVGSWWKRGICSHTSSCSLNQRSLGLEPQMDPDLWMSLLILLPSLWHWSISPHSTVDATCRHSIEGLHWKPSQPRSNKQLMFCKLFFWVA